MKFERRTLGNSGHTVAPFGIGGGYAARSKVFDMALEAGINYFLWAPSFPTYIPMTRWLNRKFKADREKILLATVTYFWKIPGSLERTVRRHLKWLGTDYIDYFHLGMIRSKDRRALDAISAYKEKGIIRHIAFSCHNRKLAAELVREWPVDLAMIRYNAAHRGAESEFFPNVDISKVGVVAFNATRHRQLLSAPKNWPSNRPVPTAGDCYRFVLTHPKVTLCLAGPSKHEHIKEILKTTEKGPMSEEEMNWMREFGDKVYGRKS